MTINELRPVLTTDIVYIFDGDEEEIAFHRFECDEENQYARWSDKSATLWLLYGYCEIKQLYADINGLNIHI